MLASTMSDASAAMILGWSGARVRKARSVLKTEAFVKSVAAVDGSALLEVVRPSPARLCPVTAACGARVGRWVRAFLSAGWGAGEVAWLFDLEPELVAGAIPAGSRA